jgi:hypothetical protein
MSEKIILTPEQQIVADSMLAFLESESEEIFTLKGVAGAGKSTILKNVLTGYDNIIAATVSHVAKSVLEDILGSVATCMTIAKLLNMRQTIDEDGEISFVPRIDKFNENFRLPIEDANIIVIDECSMVDENTHNLVMHFKSTKAKVIYTGDPFQLPAVNEINETDSVSFKFTKAELLKSVRYGGHIYELAQVIRDEISVINSGKAGSKYLINEFATRRGFDKRTSEISEDGKGVIYLNNIEDVIRITKLYHTKDNGINDLRSIAYRRKTIDIINTEMRVHLYKDQLGTSNYDEFPQFISGEVVISSGGYKNGLIHNNQCFKIVSFIEINGPHNIPCLSLKLDPNPISETTNQQIVVLDTKRGKLLYNDMLLTLKRAAEMDKRQWKDYYKFKEEFCEFEYAIANNSHRSQGSTYNNVIVFEDDILSVTKNKVKNKLQSLYVSCTRAKNILFIYNKKYKVSQSLLPESIKNELGL